MDQINLGRSGKRTSRLGYGCSSLMGATGRKESLRLLEHAYDAGIRHFDVAPSYGYGGAEGCLGEFLARHRDDVTVATKYGIAPAKNRTLQWLGRQVAGPVLKLVPSMKRHLARAADTVTVTAKGKATFTAPEAEASLHHSLTELRSDHIDIWLLHEAEADDLSDEHLLRVMEESVSSGKVGMFGIGSAAHKIPRIIAEQRQYCDVLQFEWSIFDGSFETAPGVTIHHRALTDGFRALHNALMQHRELCRRWSDSSNADLADAETLAALMFKASIVFHPSSIILFSSRNPAHILENVRVAGDTTLTESAKNLYRLVLSEGIPGLPNAQPDQL